MRYRPQAKGEARLGLCQVLCEAAAQSRHGPGAGLEAGESAPLHHLHQQQQPVRVLARRQEAADAQHLQPRTRRSAR